MMFLMKLRVKLKKQMVIEYTKDYTKIKFNLDDNLNKPLQFYQMTVTIRCIISEEMNFVHKYFQMKLCIAYKNVKV